MAFTCNTTKWVEANMPPNYNPDNYCAPSPYWSKESKFILAGLRDSIDPMIQAQMGICGTNKNLNTGSVKTVVGFKYYSIQVITAAIIDTAVTKDKGTTLASQGTALDGLSIPSGTILYGEFTEIKITAGIIRVYEHPFN